MPQQRQVPSRESVGGARPRNQEASTQTQEVNVTSEPNQSSEARDDLLIYRIVNLVLRFSKHITNESPIYSNKVIEIGRSTTGMSLKIPKEKTKPPTQENITP